jgi:hypothetical protein
MAQFGENGLFGRVLHGGNAGSIAMEAELRGVAPRERSATLRRLTRCALMTHSWLRPMDTFDPTEPAVLHDLLSDTIITWTAEEAEDYRRTSRPGEDGTVIWNAYVFDGWGNVLGG